MVQNINKQVKVHIEALCFFSAAKWFVCFSVTVTFTPYLLAPPFPFLPSPFVSICPSLWFRLCCGYTLYQGYHPFRAFSLVNWLLVVPHQLELAPSIDHFAVCIGYFFCCMTHPFMELPSFTKHLM